MAKKHCMRVLLFTLPVMLLLGGVVLGMVRLAFSSDLYFYILLVPLVSGYFFYTRRDKIFAEVAPARALGTSMIALGFIIFGVAKHWESTLKHSDFISLAAASLVVVWLGGFVFFWGAAAAKRAMFPIAFLFLTIPMPLMLSGQIVTLLMKGSAFCSYWMLKVIHIPVARHDFSLSLSHMRIGIGPRCSGIRDAVYLFMTGLVISQVYLKSASQRWILVLSAMLITVVKNGFRIVVLSLLANYVDKGVLEGPLHYHGGFPFTFMGVVALIFITRALSKREENLRHSGSCRSGFSTAAS